MLNHMKEEAKLLYHIVLAPNGGRTHAERMERYFGPQARGYDSFRLKLLQGRREMYDRMPTPEGGVWLEMGGGTGQCLEFLGDRIHRLEQVYLIDLSPSLLEVAEERARRHGWSNVKCLLLDASSAALPVDRADVATFSYSLTMIPDWFRAVDSVAGVLREGGTLGACDFYMARKHPQADAPHQSLASRLFWQLFFCGDDVFPNPDMLPFLQSRFDPVESTFGSGRVPYLPLWAPWFRFIGRVASRKAIL